MVRRSQGIGNPSENNRIEESGESITRLSPSSDIKMSLVDETTRGFLLPFTRVCWFA